MTRFIRPGSHLVGIVLGREEEGAQYDNESDRGVELQFRGVDGHGDLRAEAVNFSKHEGCPRAAAQRRSLLLTEESRPIGEGSKRKCGCSR